MLDNKAMKRFCITLTLFALAAMCMAADTAEAVMKKAYQDAAKQNKNVLVVFHASWCGWCHRFDDFLTKSDEGKKVASSYVLVHLDVLESEEKKSEENAGGEEMMNNWGGKDAGIPFMVVLDKHGKKLADSNRETGKPSTNMGYPAAKEEIAHFMGLLDKTTKLSASEKAKIRTWLVTNAPK